MVLGLRTKNRKSNSVQVDYLIYLQEIKPWPPSQSLRSLRSVLIQWKHGDRNSGSTNQVVPSLGSGSGDGRIEFDESFRLSVTLQRELSIKGGDGDTFQKNCIEFNLYEPRRDKTVKGQLLGTVIVDFADYGIVRESLSISVPMNCKRSLRNTAQPVLFLKIQLVEKSRNRSVSRDSLLREGSMERIVGESVSALMNEEYAEEAEGASFTEDDVSSHSSSIAVSSSTFESNRGSPPRKDMNGSEVMKGRQGEDKDQFPFASKQRLTNKSDMKPVAEPHGSLKESSQCSSSTDLSFDLDNQEHVQSTSHFPRPSLMLHQKNIGSHSAQSSLSSIAYEETDEVLNTNMGIKEDMKEKVLNSGSEIRRNAQESFESIESQDHQVDDLSPSIKGMHEPENAIEHGSAEDKDQIRLQESGQERQFMEGKRHYIENDDGTKKQISLGTDEHSISRENHGVKGNIPNTDRLKHMKSVRSPLDSGRSNGSVSNERKDAKVNPKETRRIISNRKVELLEHRIQMLEGELREAAAIEVSLYSVVAEHGSSTTKVHAPARRLSRLYLHACKENSRSRRASAARSAVSGLILVAKACGHDVPRLTFWLSNSVVLRAIITQAFEEQQLPLSAGPFVKTTNNGKGNTEKSSLFKWKDSSSSMENISALHERFDDWEDPNTFTSALEKIESWIFSRIIESVWWQILTPYMQSAAAKEIVRAMGSDCSKIYQRTSSSGDQEQGNFSIELWKNAFRDSCERICPVRARGHACGCLPVLSRLIMEQCVARLDVAMFNAVLRESDDEIPTDPVSDPISDAKVLPIPAGKASFGAGAQLKNAIGNWSRWLSDLFGIEENYLLEGWDEVDNCDDNEVKDEDKSFKPFHLLNALSDLMMLPKDMLLSQSIRKEVCPTFGAPLIKRILNTFVPDEFCPDQIPPVVLEALDSEDALETCEDSVLHFPCAVASIVYLPPPVVLLANILGDSRRSGSQLTRSGSLVLRKSYTSDDELDELDAPLTSIIGSSRDSLSSAKLGWILKGNGRGNDVRFQLLREVWMNSEL